MPLAPNALERLLLLRLNKAPGPVLDLIGGAGERALGLALELGIFDALSDEPATVTDLGPRINCDPEGLSPLLAFLDALGYVIAEDGIYTNTPMTTTWLVDNDGVEPWLTFWEDVVYPFWDNHLETAVRTGSPPLTLYEWLDDNPEKWRIAHEGFRATGHILAPTVVKKVDLPDGARVLDIGGGHGLYAAELSRRYTDAKVTIFDTEPTREIAEETVYEAGVTDRVQFVSGDYEVDTFDKGLESDFKYDAALLFNIVHAHDRAENILLFEKVHNMISSDGTLYILDQFEDSAWSRLGRASISFVGLTYLVTLGQGVHHVDDVGDWLEEAGFVVRTRKSFLTVPGTSLIIARRQD